MCELIDLRPHVAATEEFIKSPEGFTDFRDVIRPKRPLQDNDFEPKRYYQVYESKHGFLPNLSILDLLFNMGPESILLL